MAVIRFISALFVALALMALGSDLISWAETRVFDPHTLIGLWHTLSAPSAAALQAWINSLPDVPNAILTDITAAWAFVALGIPGVVLAIIGLRR